MARVLSLSGARTFYVIVPKRTEIQSSESKEHNFHPLKECFGSINRLKSPQKLKVELVNMPHKHNTIGYAGFIECFGDYMDVQIL